MIVPMNAYAGTYSYNDIGSVSLNRTLYSNTPFGVDYLNPVDTKLIISYDISAPTNGGQIMRIEGSVGATVGWDVGHGEDYWTLKIKIFGRRADGSLGDNTSITWVERYDPLTPQSFNVSFSENYPKLYVEVWMSLHNGESNKVSYSSTNRLENLTITGNAQCFTGIYSIDKAEINSIILNAQNAATAATGAKTAANTAATNAASALNAANSANVNAANASNNAWYNGSTYGGSAQSVGNVAGYIAYNQLPSIDNKIDNITTTINNLYGADKTTPTPVLKTVSGAMATSGSSIRAVLDITDSDSATFTFSLDNGTYSPVPSDKIIILPVHCLGTNVISVWVKDPSGNIGTTSIAIRKL